MLSTSLIKTKQKA